MLENAFVIVRVSKPVARLLMVKVQLREVEVSPDTGEQVFTPDESMDYAPIEYLVASVHFGNIISIIPPAGIGFFGIT